MSRTVHSTRLTWRLLSGLVALALALSSGGCTLFAPGEDEMSAAMNAPTEGRVSRDQYGVYTLDGPPTLYERKQAIVDAAAAIVGD